MLSINNRGRNWFLCLAAVVLASNYWIISSYHFFSSGAPPEWPMAVDLLLLLPALYFWLYRDQPRQAITGSLVIIGFGILAGSLILPTESKIWWAWLENIRYLFLLAVVLAQGVLFALLIFEISRAAHTVNMEDAAAAALERRFGDSIFSRLLKIESRMWIYAFVRKPVRAAFPGVLHFSTHLQNGNASNQQGFLIIVGAEIPVFHVLLLLFDCPPTIAWIITAVSVYGFIFLLAEYRASLLRPMSIAQDTLLIRYGIWGDLRIPWAKVESIEAFRGSGSRRSGRLRFYGTGAANVRIKMRPGALLPGLFGVSEVTEILLGVDDFQGFITQSERSVKQQSTRNSCML